MCGILGIVGESCVERFSPDRFLAALDLMRERGPDAQGFVTWPSAWFGHRRLSIIDIEGGSQPMLSADGEAMVVYNGEVFNFDEVAGRLASGGLRTRSDTEVVLEACRQLGHEQALRSFRGMFAFGLYDKRARVLLLARDPLGIKPIYYARQGRFLIFGSELEPVRRLAGNPSLRSDAVVAYFRYSYVPEPDTVYQGVLALEPGHLLTFDGNNVQVREYWRPRLGTRSTRRRHEPAVLEEAIRLSTVSDVPIASLLSGGIDTAVLASVLGPRLTYFNLRFEGSYDESDRARHTAQLLALEARFENERQEIAGDDAIALARKVGQPFGDTSLFACNLIFRAIARDYKVCLSGDGGDEIYAGYPMRRVIALDRASSTGAIPRRAIRASMRLLVRHSLNRTRLRPESLIDPALMRDYADTYWQRICTDLDWALDETDDLVNAFSYVLLRRNLPNDMLVKVDRASMLHSIEVRVPFLDHRVAEEGLSLPGMTKQTLFETKRPLRRFLAGRGFAEGFLRGRKTGFGPAAQSWTRALPEDMAERSELSDLFTARGRRLIGQSVYWRLARLWERHVYQKHWDSGPAAPAPGERWNGTYC